MAVSGPEHTAPKPDDAADRNGFIVDDRPDTKAVRCMQNCR